MKKYYRVVVYLKIKTSPEFEERSLLQMELNNLYQEKSGESAVIREFKETSQAKFDRAKLLEKK